MYRLRKQRGFSLVETLVAITILLVAILAPMRIASQSIKTAGFAREQLTAVFLAQEGIETIIHLRDSDALDGDGITMDWLNALDVAGCVGGAGCSYDAVANSFVECVPIESCMLYFDASATNGAYYTHTAASLPESGFTRVVQVTEIQPGEVQIESTVSWYSLLFRDTIPLVERTRIFDQYEQTP